MIKAYIQTFQKYRYLLGNLISRDLKLKYRRSVLGLFWSLLNPILMMLLLDAVFSILIGNNEIENYPLYLILGQILFTFFNEATNGALESVVASSALMKKIYVPKYVFPLEKVLYSFVNLLFSMIAVMIVLVFKPIKASYTMLLIPIPLGFFLMFTIGFGLILASLYAFFRDIKHLYSVIILAWMYLTPVFYPVSLVDDTPIVGTIVRLNPLTWFITYFRDLFLNSHIPSLRTTIITAGYSLGMFIIGFLVFRKAQDRFVLHL